MFITDSAIASMPLPSRGPFRALLSLFGLGALMDDQRHAPITHDVVSPPDWQQARVAAHRAIAAVERGDLAVADACFTTAFTLDRAFGPAQIPNFWSMSLSGLETAERSLRSAGRYEEAAALAGEVAYRHSPELPGQTLRPAS